MSNNTIRARLSLSFKGETYELDSVIDLDGSFAEPSEAPNFHQHLARVAGIDPYSYLYEVLEAHEIEFSNATGVAARSCCDGQFDWSQFEQDRSEEGEWADVRSIADPIIGECDWEAAPALRAALLAAYRAGKAGGA